MDSETELDDLRRRLEVAERERDQAVRARVASESRLAAAFQSVPVGIAVIDIEGEIVFANSEFRRFVPTAIPSRDPVGIRRWHAWNEEGQLLTPAQWPSARALRGETVVRQPMRYTTGDGQFVWTNVSTAPTVDHAGEITGIVCVVADIDDQKRGAEALRYSEERLRSVLNSMAEGFALFAPDFTILDVNEETLRLDGRTREQLVGQVHWHAFPGTEKSALGELYRRAMHERVALALEHRYSWPDGREMWVDVRVYPTPDGNLACFWRDSTERKRAAERLRESEAKIRTMFETMLEACCIFDLIYDDLGNPVDWRILEANPGYERASGLKDVAGRLASEVMPGTEPYWIEAFGRVVETGEAEQIEKWHQPTGRWIHSSTARVGGAGSRRLVSVFYDITERKQAEIALRESEQRFQQFAAASSGALWIRDAATMKMEYVSAAANSIYGIDPAELLGGVQNWAAHVLPEDRDIALEHIERARQGEAVVHQFRIQRPSDQSFRWIRDIGFPLYDDEGRIQRVGGIAEDVTEAKLAVEHQSVLLAELQHRVRNIMAIIRSITARTAANAADVSDYASRMSGRLLALARVQALLTRKANAGVDLRSVLQEEISAQNYHEGQHFLSGPHVELSPKVAEVLTLAVHELATNALKYGALSVSHGKVEVRWDTSERQGRTWLEFDWIEEGAPAPRNATSAKARRRGFGSELIEGRIPYELKGRGELSIEPGGARCHLEIPLQAGGSVLETSAPQQTTVFGGALDMTGEPDLTGYRVLVVEDDYYLATDTARALRGAGAAVMGPSPTEEEASNELKRARPDAVVVDINLGSGPSFKFARRLKDERIPFVFVTGYDEHAIPAEFDDIARLEKPAQLRQIVGTIANLLGGDS